MTEAPSPVEEAMVLFPDKLGSLSDFCESVRRDLSIIVTPDQQVQLAQLCYRLIFRGTPIVDALAAAQYFSPIIATEAEDQVRLADYVEQKWQFDKKELRNRRREPTTPIEVVEAEIASERRMSSIEKFVLPAIVASGVWGVYEFFQSPFGSGNGGSAGDRGVDGSGGGDNVGSGDGIAPLLEALGNPNMQFVAGVLLTTLLAYVIWRQSQRMGVARDLSFRDASAENLQFDEDQYRIYRNAVGRESRILLTRHVEEASHLIDVPKSVAATVQAAGAFTAVNKSHPRLPRYLVLVSRDATDDHISIFADDLHRLLGVHRVHLERFDYFGAPYRARSVTLDGSVAESVTFGEILARAPGRRWLLVADPRSLLDRAGRAPQEWLKLLARSASGVILSPTPKSQWAEPGAILNTYGIEVYQANSKGLRNAALSFNHESGDGLSARPRTGAASSSYMALDYFYRSPRWLTDDEPDLETRDAIQYRLKAYLEPEGYELLAALSIYPELKPGLTRMIGKTVEDGNGRSLMTGARLERLVSLPWFRSGRIPIWLRADLRKRMTAKRLNELEQAVHRVLVEPADHGVLSLEVVASQPWLIASVLSKMIPPDSPASRDAIFLQSLGRGSGQGDLFEVSRAFARRVRSHTPMFAIFVVAAVAMVLLIMPQFADRLGVVGDIAAALMRVGQSLSPIGFTWAETAILFGLALVILNSANLEVQKRFKKGLRRRLWSHNPKTIDFLAVACCGVGLLFALAAYMALEISAQQKGSILFAPVIRVDLSLFQQMLLLAAALTFTVMMATASEAARPAKSIADFLRGRSWVFLTAAIVALVFYAVMYANEYIDSVDMFDPELYLLFGVLFILVLFALKERLSLRYRDMGALLITFLSGLAIGEGAYIFSPESDFNLAPVFALAAVALYFERIGVHVSGTIIAIVIASLIWLNSMGTVPPEAGLIYPLAIFVLLTTCVGNICRAETGSFDLGWWGLTKGRKALHAISVLMIASIIFAAEIEDAETAHFFGYFLLWPALVATTPNLRGTAPGPYSAYVWEEIKKKWPKGLWAWSPLIPFLWLVPSMKYVGDGIRVDVSLLALPLGLLLGHFLGRNGFIILAVGLAPYLFGIGISDFPLRTVGEPALYFAALLLCRFAGMPEFRIACVRARELSPQQYAFLFVALTIGSRFNNNIFDIVVRQNMDPMIFVYVATSLVGLSRVSAAVFFRHALLVWSLFFFVFQFSSRDFHFPSLGGFRVTPTFTEFYQLIALLVFFILGRATREWMLKPDVFVRRVPLLAFICFAAMLIENLVLRINWDLAYNVRVNIYENAMSVYVPLAIVFFLGMFGGIRGVLYACGALLAAKLFVPLAVNEAAAAGWLMPVEQQARDMSLKLSIPVFDSTLIWRAPDGDLGLGYEFRVSHLTETVGFWWAYIGDFVLALCGWAVRAIYMAPYKILGTAKYDERAAYAARDDLLDALQSTLYAGKKRTIPFLQENLYFDIAVPFGYIVRIWAFLLLCYYALSFAITMFS